MNGCLILYVFCLLDAAQQTFCWPIQFWLFVEGVQHKFMFFFLGSFSSKKSGAYKWKVNFLFEGDLTLTMKAVIKNIFRMKFMILCVL